MIRVVTNVPEVIRSLNGKIESFFPGAGNYEGLLRTVATTTMAEMKTRIHENGLASDGTLIGKYSRKPMYVSKSANVGRSFGRPIGKTGKSKFKSGADHSSRYFPGGYDEYKTTIGRNKLGSVNLSLSGQLNSQLSIQPTETGYGIGWEDAEKFKIAKAMEKKYGKKIWALTEEEKTLTITTAKNYLKRALS
jgi:hypothetical protein